MRSKKHPLLGINELSNLAGRNQSIKQYTGTRQQLHSMAARFTPGIPAFHYHHDTWRVTQDRPQKPDCKHPVMLHNSTNWHGTNKLYYFTDNSINTWMQLQPLITVFHNHRVKFCVFTKVLVENTLHWRQPLAQSSHSTCLKLSNIAPQSATWYTHWGNFDLFALSHHKIDPKMNGHLAWP